MRRALVALVPGALLLLAACGGAPPAADAGVPEPGGTLRHAISTWPTCLDPALSGGRLFTVPEQIGETLTGQAADGTIVPRLADSWEIADGGRTYTFHLRPGVTFADGTAVDAGVVAQNLTALVALNAAGKSDTLTRNALNSFTGSEVLDPATIRLHFGLPELGFLRNASDPYLTIWSAGTAALPADRRCAGELVGSGPFAIQSVTRNQRVDLVKRPEHGWSRPELGEHEGPAYLDAITYEVVPESGVRVGGLLSGQFDVIDDVPVADQESVRAAGGSVVLGTVPNLVPGIYHNPYSPLGGDLAVRKAILLAIDRTEIRDTVYGPGYEVPTGEVARNTPLFTDLSAQLRHDPAAAAAILDQAGWTPGPDGVRVKDGVRLEPRLTYVAGSTRGATQQDLELVQQQLRPVGIAVQLVPQTAAEASADLADVSKARFDFASGAGAGKDVDFLIGLFRSTNPRLGGFANPGLEAAADALDTATDDASRAAAAAALQRYIVDDAQWIPVREATRAYAAAARVHGYRVDPYAQSVFHDTWLQQ